MAVVKCKPTSPGRRFVVKVVNADLHKGKPYAPLVEKKARLVVVTMLVVSLPVTWWWSQAALPYRRFPSQQGWHSSHR